MARHAPGLTLTPSPQAVELVRERLQRAGHPITEAAACSLLEAVLAIEGPRMQAIARGILHGSLETIRQTAELALAAFREERREQDPVEAVEEPSGGESTHQTEARVPRHLVERDDEDEDQGGEDPRPVFKRRRGRGR